MKIKCAHTKLVNLEELTINPKNRNNHPEKQSLKKKIMIQYYNT